MKRIILFLLFIFSLSIVESRAENANSVLDKAAALVKKAKGVKAVFSISGAGGKMQGELLSSGTRFYVRAGGMQTWYNGKDMYTYNPSSKETTVVHPSTSELAETNPLMYLNVYKSYFTPTLSKKSGNGKYVVELKPISRKTPVKKVTVVINSKTFQPNEFVITSTDGQVTTTTISSVNYGADLSSSAFEYPRKKFPNTKLIDLR